MFELIRPGTSIDFVGKRRLWIGISIIAILATVIGFFTKGLNYGVDFSGGAEVQLKIPSSWDISKLRSTLEAGSLKDLKIQQLGEPQAGEFMVRAHGGGDQGALQAVALNVENALNKQLKPGEYVIERTEVVGPAAGESLRKSGFLSMLYALLCILIYVTIRFDFRYAPGAVIALFHDSVITLGIFIILQKPFDLQILAALLALIGYSNNDTIIVYDRVRETVHHYPDLSIEQAVNRAVNETLGRTILTSLCTFITVFSLWILGGKVIEDFAFTLMVGIVVGTYSSIFIASSLVITITHYFEKRVAKAKSGSAGKRPITARPEPKYQA